MRSLRLRTLAAIAIATVFTASAVAAATPAISVGSVDGQTVRHGSVRDSLRGRVEVAGTATLGAGGASDVAAPLVADAGDSPFVQSGSMATLIGTGWGGQEPYAYAWSAAAGTIAEGADSATALVDTAGLAPGRLTATLRVTDAVGASATDTVVVVVGRAGSQTLLDKTATDTLPNVGLGNPTLTNYLDMPFQVPAGISSLSVEVSWTNPLNDYDLHLIDPTGTERGYSGNGATNLTLQYESTGTAAPVAGTWKLRHERYLTATDTIHAVVVGLAQDPDPRPVVSAGGPYRFAIDAAQPLSGTVTGGTTPVASAWDLDGDGRFETAGTDVTVDACRRPPPRDPQGDRRAGPGAPPDDVGPGCRSGPARRGHHGDHRDRGRRFGRQSVPPRVQRHDLPGPGRPGAHERVHPTSVRVHQRLPGRRDGVAAHHGPGLLPGEGQAERSMPSNRGACTGSRAPRSSAPSTPTIPRPATRRPMPPRSWTTTATAPARPRSRPATGTATARPACSSSSRDSTRRSRPATRSSTSPATASATSAARRSDRSSVPMPPHVRLRSAARPSCSPPATASATRSTSRSRRTAPTRPVPAGTSRSGRSGVTTSGPSSATASRSTSAPGATATCRRPAAPARSGSAPSAAPRPRPRTPPESSERS